MIRLNHRPRLLACLGLVALPAALLFGAFALPGCDKDKKDGALTPGTVAVGIVDYERVFTDIGWKATIQKDLDATKQNYKIAFDSFSNELSNAVKDKRSQIATAAKLTPKQIEDFANMKEAGDLEKLNLTQAQKAEFVQAVNNANALQGQANQDAVNLLRYREQQLGQIHVDALKAPLRKVAESNGISVVLASGSVQYFSTGVDITNKVVDDLRAAAPVINIPAAQKLEYKKVRLDAPASGPSTQPAK